MYLYMHIYIHINAQKLNHWHPGAWHLEGGSGTTVSVYSDLKIVPCNTLYCQRVASNEHTPFQPGVHVCFEYAPKTSELTLYNVIDTSRQRVGSVNCVKAANNTSKRLVIFTGKAVSIVQISSNNIKHTWTYSLVKQIHRKFHSPAEFYHNFLSRGKISMLRVKTSRHTVINTFWQRLGARLATIHYLTQWCQWCQYNITRPK